MPKWEKFTGSNEQLKEIEGAKNGILLRYANGVISDILFRIDLKCLSLSHALEYLICIPNPHAEMIQRWANTGQPVYRFDEYDNEWQLTQNPQWLAKIKYSFNPPKKKEFIEVKEYLCRSTNDGSYYTSTIQSPDFVKFGEQRSVFVRWLDDDWRKIEI